MINSERRGNMQYIENQNGRRFEIMKVYETDSSNYALLYDTRQKDFVVVTGLQADYWEYGEYYRDIELASEQFEQKVYNYVKQKLVEDTRLNLKIMAFENVVIEDGEPFAWFDKSDYFDELIRLMRDVHTYDQEYFDQHYQQFIDELICDEFVDVQVTAAGVEVLVEYAHLYDQQVGYELEQIPRYILNQHITEEEQKKWIEYYTQYTGKNEYIDEILQVEKIQIYLNTLSVQTLQEFCRIDSTVNQNKIEKIDERRK